MRRALLDAAYRVLASDGGQGCTLRAVEAAAGAPHGSVRHHFGGKDGMFEALVDDLIADDRAQADAQPSVLVAGYLGEYRTRTVARYELFMVAMRRPELRQRIVEARDELVALVQARGADALQARMVVAALDGLVLDGLLRAELPDPAAVEGFVRGLAH